jgi:hypothetical protein
MPGGFSQNSRRLLGGPGWARSAPSIPDRAAGGSWTSAVDRVHWSTVDQAKGGSPRFNLDHWLRDQRLRTSAHARRRRTAGLWRHPAGTSPEVRRRTQTRARDHCFGRGLVLREAGATGKLIGWLRRRLRWPWWLAPRGGGSPALGEWRHALRLGTKEKEGGEEFLTARRSFGRRGNDEEDDGGGDPCRRPVPMGGGGRAREALGALL